MAAKGNGKWKKKECVTDVYEAICALIMSWISQLIFPRLLKEEVFYSGKRGMSLSCQQQGRGMCDLLLN